MRGPMKACLLLAPVLASALALPITEVQEFDERPQPVAGNLFIRPFFRGNTIMTL